MSDGPFKPGDFNSLDNLPASFPLSWNLVADHVNAHPFVKEARELAEYCSKVHIPKDGCGGDDLSAYNIGAHVAACDIFLRRWFPEEKQK